MADFTAEWIALVSLACMLVIGHMYEMQDKLVSTQWLADSLGEADIRIVDASWYLPGAARDAAAEYASRHIPGAIFLDLNTLADPDSNLPMMLPGAAQFRQVLEGLGIGDQHRIIIYDDSPLRTSARAWWIFVKVFGLRDVAILDGGLAKWVSEGRAVDAAIPVVQPARLTLTPNAGAARDKAQVLAEIGTGVTQIVDARPVSRFAGEDPEPRPNVVAGHIPGSLNLPHDRLFESDGRWKTGAALQSAFEDSGIDLEHPLIFTCGSGTTAAVLRFGAHLLGKGDAALYDGSWAEWGSDPALPKSIGRV